MWLKTIKIACSAATMQYIPRSWLNAWAALERFVVATGTISLNMNEPISATHLEKQKLLEIRHLVASAFQLRSRKSDHMVTRDAKRTLKPVNSRLVVFAAITGLVHISSKIDQFKTIFQWHNHLPINSRFSCDWLSSIWDGRPSPEIKEFRRNDRHEHYI